MDEKRRVYEDAVSAPGCAKQEREPSNRLSDSSCYHRAVSRGQPTFTVVGQDATSPRIIIEWIKENIETCPPPKLYEALARAIQMRDFPYRKNAD